MSLNGSASICVLALFFISCVGFFSSGARADEGAAAATPPPKAENPRAQRQSWLAGKQLEWWGDFREQLFTDIDLTSEQVQEIESILEEHVARREEYRKLHDELSALQCEGDRERASELRREIRRLRPELVPSVSIEAIRECLADEQRPTFDMNRAKFVAEGQRQREQRQRRRSERVRTEVE